MPPSSPASPASPASHPPNPANMSPVEAPETTNRFHVLCHDQVVRLHQVMSDVLPIHGRGNFPTLEPKLTDIIQVVRNKLKSEGISIRDIRMNGGGASYIIGTENVQPYNDVDLIFGVDLQNANDLQKIKVATLDCLLDFLPEGVNKKKMTSASLKDAYINKLVKVCTEHDKWSLISFCNRSGRNVELKFVNTMKRQFEFTVDSFQIILDSLLTFYEVSEKPMSEHFYPTVIAESVYGNFEEALYHLNKKLISTRQPEEIRGGGLLKYCHLLVRDYQAASDVDLYSLQRYMCSRFFIDFSDICQQRQMLENYLTNHFRDDEHHIMYDFLMILHNVVDESTICLMGHERRQTLALIQYMAYQVLSQHEERKRYEHYGVHHFDVHNNLVIDQVFYGPHLTYYTNGYCYVYPPQPDQVQYATPYMTCSEEEDTGSDQRA